MPFLLPVFASSLFSYIPWLAISGWRVQSSTVQRFKVPHKRKAESGLCHSKFDVQCSMFNVPHSPVSAFQYFSLSAFPRRPPFKVQGSRFKVQRFSRSTRLWIDRNVRCPIPILKGLDPSARGCSRRATPGGRRIGAPTLNGSHRLCLQSSPRRRSGQSPAWPLFSANNRNPPRLSHIRMYFTPP